MTRTKLVPGSKFNPFNSTGNQTLLISPPIYDVRLDWPSWHTPTGLLKLGALLKAQHRETRLIDCLYIASAEKLTRRKIGSVQVQGRQLDKWHFGLAYGAVERQIRRYVADGWTPSTTYITSLNSIWWESTRDTIALIRKLLPKTTVVLGGAYPTVVPEHARIHSGADLVVSGAVPQLNRFKPDVSLYENIPYSTNITFYRHSSIYSNSKHLKPRSTSAIFNEVRKKAEAGVREFVICDQEIRMEDGDAFSILLDELADLDRDVHFVLPGNIEPKFINRALARKLRRAHVTNIYLRCKLEFGPHSIRYASPLTEYDKCMDALLTEQVVKPRGDRIAAMLVAGLPFEDLDILCERMVRLAHIVGSVIVLPFQYVPGLHSGALFERTLAQNDNLPPESYNSKLFPIARLSGKSLEDYIEVMRLATLVNSKYRSKTFDFLGDGLAARLFRESIRTGAWNPFATVTGATSTAYSAEWPLIEEPHDSSQ